MKLAKNADLLTIYFNNSNSSRVESIELVKATFSSSLFKFNFLCAELREQTLDKALDVIEISLRLNVIETKTKSFRLVRKHLSLNRYILVSSLEDIALRVAVAVGSCKHFTYRRNDSRSHNAGVLAKRVCDNNCLSQF